MGSLAVHGEEEVTLEMRLVFDDGPRVCEDVLDTILYAESDGSVVECRGRVLRTLRGWTQNTDWQVISTGPGISSASMHRPTYSLHSVYGPSLRSPSTREETIRDQAAQFDALDPESVESDYRVDPTLGDDEYNAFHFQFEHGGGGDGPLADLDVAVKKNIVVAGVPTTCGSPGFEFDPPHSATVVDRMVDDGATLGTDTGGSVRIPASFCGVVGIKPTHQRVSRFGVVDLSQSLDHVGSLARDAEPAARVLETIS